MQNITIKKHALQLSNHIIAEVPIVPIIYESENPFSHRKNYLKSVYNLNRQTKTKF